METDKKEFNEQEFFDKEKKEFEKLKTKDEKRNFINDKLYANGNYMPIDEKFMYRYNQFLIELRKSLGQGENISGKLQWNGQKNVLIDIFYQLKRITNSKGKPLLPNSSDEVAQFLKNNFECFSKDKISTIRPQLDKKDNVQKSEKKIVIECKK